MKHIVKYPMGNVKNQPVINIAGRDYVVMLCMQLVGYLNQEREMGTPEYADLWDIRFSQAKSGQCAYRDKCPIYARTFVKQKKKPIQLTLNF